MSERTARFHVANVKGKLNASTRVQAVTKAMELRLIAG
jgi:DNA-binding CsgD family transcriptional regulator